MYQDYSAFSTQFHKCSDFAQDTHFNHFSISSMSYTLLPTVCFIVIILSGICMLNCGSITNMCSKRLSTISNKDSLVVYIARLEGETRDSTIGL
ncbi:hypothetical protein OBBRIDRAFT_528474 [Obba rivulosa]|uniref:Uncharacterized protein n=1 Tax=Obba rivulosa TaxID=1052685 RepID=A0A8E2DIC8_9APHY|nr:hypothetical protein OBBRIDRAFT_528474 [Obba rivulosa]